jgi:hypothetical protein
MSARTFLETTIPSLSATGAALDSDQSCGHKRWSLSSLVPFTGY